MWKGRPSFVVFILTTTLSAVASNISWKPSAFRQAQAEMSAEAVPEKSSAPSDPYTDFPKKLTPFEIAAFIDSHPRVDLTKLWNALGISVQEFNGMHLNQNSEYQFFPIGCANCEAETFEYDLDGQPGSEVMLRIGERSPYICRYLIFKNVNEKWKLLGHLDAEGKYRKPQHTILINHGIPWVDIQEQGANGTGVASYVDRVYLVTPTKITRGFAYLSEGSQLAGRVLTIATLMDEFSIAHSVVTSSQSTLNTQSTTLGTIIFYSRRHTMLCSQNASAATNISSIERIQTFQRKNLTPFMISTP
jgi:hypothetical protein